MRYITSFAAALLFATAAGAASAPDLPKTNRTPGVIDPAVKQSNIDQNVCTSGYTATLRPNVKKTNAIKKKQLAAWGYTDRNMKHYEEDHLISLQLGGAADDEGNLWPEHYSGKWGARVKDTLEGELNRRICSSSNDPDHITLKEGQDAISTDWKAAYAKYVCGRTPPLSPTMKSHCPDR